MPVDGAGVDVQRARHVAQAEGVDADAVDLLQGHGNDALVRDGAVHWPPRGLAGRLGLGGRWHVSCAKGGV